jgi:di/tricarboxylate transporter
VASEVWLVVAVMVAPLALVFRGRWRSDVAGSFRIVASRIALGEVCRSIEWEIIVFVVGTHAMGLALVNTALTQAMGSQSTAFIVGPIAVGSGIALRVHAHAIAAAAAVGCSSAFLTPIAHPVNLMVVGPATAGLESPSGPVQDGWLRRSWPSWRA